MLRSEHIRNGKEKQIELGTGLHMSWKWWFSSKS